MGAWQQSWESSSGGEDEGDGAGTWGKGSTVVKKEDLSQEKPEAQPSSSPLVSPSISMAFWPHIDASHENWCRDGQAPGWLITNSKQHKDGWGFDICSTSHNENLFLLNTEDGSYKYQPLWLTVRIFFPGLRIFSGDTTSDAPRVPKAHVKVPSYGNSVLEQNVMYKILALLRYKVFLFVCF